MGENVDIGTLLAHIGLDTRGLKQGQAESNAAIASLQTSLKGLAKIAGAIGIGVGLTAITAKIWKVGSEYEAVMTRIRAQTRATAEEMRQLQQATMQARNAMVAAEVLGAIAEEGENAATALQLLRPALVMMKAHSLDVNTAVSILLDTMEAYRLGTRDATRINDIFTGSMRIGSQSIQDVKAALKAAGPVATALGYTLEEVAGGIAVLAERNLEGARGGSAMVGSMRMAVKVGNELNLGTTKLIPILEKLKERGYSAQQVMELFGRRTGVAAMILYNALPAVAEYSKKIKEAGGSTAEMAKIMRQTTAQAFKDLASEIQKVQITAFSGMKDAVKRHVDEISKSVKEGRTNISANVATIVWAVVALGEGIWSVIRTIVVPAVHLVQFVFETIMTIVEGLQVPIAFILDWMTGNYDFSGTKAQLNSVKEAWHGMSEEANDVISSGVNSVKAGIAAQKAAWGDYLKTLDLALRSGQPFVPSPEGPERGVPEPDEEDGGTAKLDVVSATRGAYEAILADTRRSRAELLKVWDQYVAFRRQQIKEEETIFALATGNRTLAAEKAQSDLNALEEQRKQLFEMNQVEAYQRMVQVAGQSIEKMQAAWTNYVRERLKQIDEEWQATLRQTGDAVFAAKDAAAKIAALGNEQRQAFLERMNGERQAQLDSLYGYIEDTTRTRDEIKAVWDEYVTLRVKQIKAEADELRRLGATAQQVARFIAQQLRMIKQEQLEKTGSAWAKWAKDSGRQVGEAFGNTLYDVMNMKVLTLEHLWLSFLGWMKEVFQAAGRALAEDFGRAIADALKKGGNRLSDWIAGGITGGGGGGFIDYTGEGEALAARGGIFTRPTRTILGEAGPEAVIPLDQVTNGPLNLKRRGGASVVMYVQTPEPHSFKQSQAQLMARVAGQITASDRGRGQ